MTIRTLGVDGQYWPTAVQVVERIAELTQRATTAERERDESRAELERVKQERDSAQHFLSRIIEHCDDDGIMADDTTINLVAARKAAGIQEP